MTIEVRGPRGLVNFPDRGLFRTLSGETLQTRFLGRNGAMKCSGLHVDVTLLAKGSLHGGFQVTLSPYTSRLVRGSCDIELPPDPVVLRQLAGKLPEAADQLGDGRL